MKALDFIKEVELFYSMDKHDAKKCNEAIKELGDLENRSCDNCKYRVLHMYYEREKATIDKCSIRKDLRLNGSCDGLKCNKWESKNENL